MRRINGWVIAGAFFLALVLLTLCGLSFLLTRQPLVPSAGPTIPITLIPAPNRTQIATEGLTPRPTLVPQPTADKSGITAGVYVQIIGTGGEGLKLRSSPGLEGAAKFLGMEAEVFLVRAGPKDADYYTWWYLVAPYDQNRSGWAVSKYLSVVPVKP